MIPWNAAGWRQRNPVKPRPMHKGEAHGVFAIPDGIVFSDESCRGCGYVSCGCVVRGSREELQDRKEWIDDFPWMADVPLYNWLQWYRSETDDHDELRPYLPEGHPERYVPPATDDEPRPHYDFPVKPGIEHGHAARNSAVDNLNEHIVTCYLKGEVVIGVDPDYSRKILDNWAVGVAVAVSKGAQVDALRRERANTWTMARVAHFRSTGLGNTVAHFRAAMAQKGDYE